MSKLKKEINIFCTFNEKIEFEKLLERVFLEYLQEKKYNFFLKYIFVKNYAKLSLADDC